MLYKRLTKNRRHKPSHQFKRHIRMRKEVSMCKLKPDISKNSQKLGKIRNSGVPLHKRYNKELVKRRTKLQTLKRSVEELYPEPSFTPKINPRSRARVSRSPQMRDLSYNTKKFLRRKKERLNQVRDYVRMQENKELTFQPKINQKSSKIAKRVSKDPHKTFIELIQLNLLLF